MSTSNNERRDYYYNKVDKTSSLSVSEIEDTHGTALVVLGHTLLFYGILYAAMFSTFQIAANSIIMVKVFVLGRDKSISDPRTPYSYWPPT